MPPVRNKVFADGELQPYINKRQPRKTTYQRSYAKSAFYSWRTARNNTVQKFRAEKGDDAEAKQDECLMPNLELDDMDVDTYNYQVAKFVTEFNGCRGEGIRGTSINSILDQIRTLMKKNGKDFNHRSNPKLVDIKMAIDVRLAEDMKESEEITTVQEQDVIEISEEDKMWQMGLLASMDKLKSGEASPVALLDTLIYLTRVNLVKRGRKKLRGINLKMFDFHACPDDVSKETLSYKGWIESNGKPESLHPSDVGRIITHNHSVHPERCYLCIFLFYISVLPDNRREDALFFRPRKRPIVSEGKEIWFYGDQVRGENEIAKAGHKLSGKIVEHPSKPANDDSDEQTSEAGASASATTSNLSQVTIPDVSSISSVIGQPSSLSTTEQLMLLILQQQAELIKAITTHSLMKNN